MKIANNVVTGGVRIHHCIHRGGGSGGAGGAQAPPTAIISMKPPLSPSYKFEKEEGGEGLEEEEESLLP